MKKKYFRILSIILLISVITSTLTACSGVEQFEISLASSGESDVSVVSFNVAAPWGNILSDSSSKRVERFAAYMNTLNPDSIGTQEMNKAWTNKLSTLMENYDSYSVARGGDSGEKKSEMNSIFWLKDKYDCIDKKTFWLSTTPDKESKFDDAGCNRICSYVVLENKENGSKYIHMNTHLDNASNVARVYGANVILDKIEELNKKYKDVPIVLSGDFNDTIGGEAPQLLSEYLNVETVGSNTYHDWGKITEGEPIDFIYTSAKIVDCLLLNDTTNGFISDHYGVYQTIKF